jgi:cell fate (sporulation/competence/biofilm development) regulator YmcA (YheA/YmcA/DUF963 family)
MWLSIVAFFKNARNVITVLLFIRKAAVAIGRWVGIIEQNKESDRMKDAESKLDEANKIEDDSERLKAKAKAACEIEKTINPDSNCR